MFNFLPTLLLLTSILLITIPQQSSAQLLNPGFETWVPSGQPPPFNWEQPESWLSTNAQTEWTSAGVRPTTDVHTGTKACQLQSVNIAGGWFSSICNGTPQTAGGFDDPQLDIITGGTPVSMKPGKLTGFYKFDNADPTDSAYAVVILKNYNSAQSKYDTIGWGEHYFPEVTNYTAFELTITDLIPGTTPDSIVVAFYSTNPNNPKAPNFPAPGLFIDELDLEVLDGVAEVGSKGLDVLVFPNPAGDYTMLKLTSADDVSISLVDLYGRVLYVEQLTNGTGMVGHRLDLTGFAAGVYFLSVRSEGGEVLRKVVRY